MLLLLLLLLLLSSILLLLLLLLLSSWKRSEINHFVVIEDWFPIFAAAMRQEQTTFALMKGSKLNNGEVAVSLKICFQKPQSYFDLLFSTYFDFNNFDLKNNYSRIYFRILSDIFQSLPREKLPFDLSKGKCQKRWRTIERRTTSLDAFSDEFIYLYFLLLFCIFLNLNIFRKTDSLLSWKHTLSECVILYRS